MTVGYFGAYITSDRFRYPISRPLDLSGKISHTGDRSDQMPHFTTVIDISGQTPGGITYQYISMIHRTDQIRLPHLTADRPLVDVDARSTSRSVFAD